MSIENEIQLLGSVSGLPTRAVKRNANGFGHNGPGGLLRNVPSIS